MPGLAVGFDVRKAMMQIPSENCTDNIMPQKQNTQFHRKYYVIHHGCRGSSGVTRGFALEHNHSCLRMGKSFQSPVCRAASDVRMMVSSP
jgi:hypothetical protein